jgi:hypothetical protein
LARRPEEQLKIDQLQSLQIDPDILEPQVVIDRGASVRWAFCAQVNSGETFTKLLATLPPLLA